VVLGHTLTSFDLYWLALSLNILALVGMANLAALALRPRAGGGA
jgi:hypothetical protein